MATSPKNRKLRLGMVGGGQGAFIGHVHRMVASLDLQWELVAGCFSRDHENTLKTGKQFYLDPARCYRSFEEMADREKALPDDERIDAVSIVTPNNSHFAIARSFLEHGFHVICDKPMTFTLEEAKSLVKLVEKSGLVFVLTHNYTANPMIREARRLVRSGQIGTIRKVLVEYLQDFLMLPLEEQGHRQAAWRVDPKQSGVAGTLGDIGTHAFNLLEFITGDPVTSMCVDKSTFLPKRKLDEDANILVRLKGGGKGVISVSQIATGEENALTVRIYGSRGALQWAQENPNYLSVLANGKPRQIYTRNAAFASKDSTKVSRIPSGHPEGYLEAFANLYVEAASLIRAHAAGKPVPPAKYDVPTVYDGLRGMEFIVSAVESGAKGAVWVEMPKPRPVPAG